MYEHYLRPLMVNQQRVNVWYVPKGKDPLNKREDIITAAEKYIQEHGTGELQYMLDNVRMNIFVTLSFSLQFTKLIYYVLLLQAEVHRRNSSSYYGYADDYGY